MLLGQPLRHRFHDNPYMWMASYFIGLISRRLKKEKISDSVGYVLRQAMTVNLNLNIQWLGLWTRLNAGGKIFKSPQLCRA